MKPESLRLMFIKREGFNPVFFCGLEDITSKIVYEYIIK